MGSGTSRVNRYDNENKTVGTRISRNKNLYDDFNNFEKYTSFTDVSKIEAVPLDSLRENANKREGYRYLKDYDLVEKKKERKELDDFNYLYRNTRGNYNLKEALEEARESREKDELEKKRKLRNEKYNILESSEEELNEFKEEQKKRHKPIENEEELEELINTITSKEVREELDKEKETSLLSDLMATSNLEEVVEPIKEEEVSKPLKDEIDKSFYTKSMDLSSGDFFDDEDENKKEPVMFTILRVILSLILIVAVGFAVYYIVTNF